MKEAASASAPTTGVRLLVSMTAVEKTYRRGSEVVQALADVRLNLFEGELVGVVGPSGSGKTTLLNVLSGWETPDSGSIAWRGGAHLEPLSRPWHEIALVPQSLGLAEELTVSENVELPATMAPEISEISGDGLDERVGFLLDSLGLDHLAGRMPQEISMGEQQRVAVARALLWSPDLVLADEPTGHQDAEWADSVFWLLEESARQGTCCVVATHNMEVAGHAHRLVSMSDGAVAPDDSESSAAAAGEVSPWAPKRDAR